MYKVLILPLAFELSPSDMEDLARLVPAKRREDVYRLRNVRDRQNTLLGEILVRFEVCRTAGIRSGQLQFAYSPYGKPYIEENLPFHFNISHSGSYIACAFDDRPVGIDIEQIQAVDFSIVDRFFTESEQQYIYHTEHEREERFFEIWTKKESFIKYNGAGLSMPLDSFSVCRNDSHGEAIFFHRIFQNTEVICHLCSEKPSPPENHILEWTSLKKFVFSGLHI